jgi:hypothetical protein
MYGRTKNCIQNFSGETSHLQDQDAAGKIILYWALGVY